jgi:hypothetical protein
MCVQWKSQIMKESRADDVNFLIFKKEWKKKVFFDLLQYQVLTLFSFRLPPSSVSVLFLHETHFYFIFRFIIDLTNFMCVCVCWTFYFIFSHIINSFIVVATFLCSASFSSLPHLFQAWIFIEREWNGDRRQQCG